MSGPWRTHVWRVLLALNAFLLVEGPAYGATGGSERTFPVRETRARRTRPTVRPDQYPLRSSVARLLPPRSGFDRAGYSCSRAPVTARVLLHATPCLRNVPTSQSVQRSPSLRPNPSLTTASVSTMTLVAHARHHRRARDQAVNRERLYLFAHPAGGVHALTLSLLESNYFAQLQCARPPDAT